MKRIVLINCSLLLFLFVYPVPSFGLPAQDIQLVLDAQYVQVAQRSPRVDTIKGSSQSPAGLLSSSKGKGQQMTVVYSA